MPVDGGVLIALFLLGVAGSPHCLGMCGGIACALSWRGGRSPLLTISAAHLGRLVSYTGLGLVAGSVSTVAISWLPVLLAPLRIIAAAVLLAAGLRLLGVAGPVRWLEQMTQRLQSLRHPEGGSGARFRSAGLQSAGFSAADRTHAGMPRAGNTLLLGVSWGLLPCGMVYGALASSALLAHPLAAAAGMFAFGLGTLPAVGAAGMFMRMGRGIAGARPLCGLVIVAFAAISLELAVSGLDPHQSAPAHAHHHHL